MPSAPFMKPSATAARRPTGPGKPLRVVELATWLAGPGATALLADRGAEVIKVEPPGGDPGRGFISALGGDVASTPSFSLLNRGKKSVVLDLAQTRPRDQLWQLLAGADVFVTSLRAASLDRLGLAPEAVLTAFPRLVYASITGLGLRGPERNTPTYDVGGFWARSGMTHQTTAADSAPVAPTGGFGDIVTSLALYAAITTALLERGRSGQGGLVETSLMQCGAFMASGDLAVAAAHGQVASPMSRGGSATPLVNSYRAGDGRWFFLTCVEARRHFPKLCWAIARPELVDDPRFDSSRHIRKNSRELITLLDAAFAQAPLAHWAQRFAESDVWWQAVATPADVLNDPQLQANDMTRSLWDGGRRHAMVAAPFRISVAPSETGRAPELGEHTDAVLASLGPA